MGIEAIWIFNNFSRLQLKNEVLITVADPNFDRIFEVKYHLTTRIDIHPS